MDFFEQQDRARSRSRWLIVLFLIAVVGIAGGVTIVVALLAHALGSHSVSIAVPDANWLASNRDLLIICAAGTITLIGIASWVRLIQLRQGGGAVASSLGGTIVLSEDPDPLRRRLYNVVEEIAIASSIPVPSVYVLEAESAINAFAAGQTTSDAAVAVTRGALRQLSRDELQGVIGHEFSHILNGDMRLNVRLMGFLFGILVVNFIGRAMTRTGGRRGIAVSSSRNRGAGVVALAGVALLILGYVGVLIGRIIQAAVSRQREFLADASAVQFTRQASGLADALKKIGGLNEQSWLINPRSEEVSHMLFASGRRLFTGLLATHPPLKERIRKLQPYVRLDGTAGPATAASEHSVSMPGTIAAAAAGLAGMAEESLSTRVGTPDEQDIARARQLHNHLPEALWEAAHSRDGALCVILALVMDHDPSVRHHQELIIVNRFGDNVSSRVMNLAASVEPLPPGIRLSLVDIAFPALRMMQQVRREFLLDTIYQLIEVDGNIDAFEAALAGLLTTRMTDLDSTRRRNRSDSREKHLAVVRVLAAMAIHGHEIRAEAETAFQAGISSLAGDLAVPAATPLPTKVPPVEALVRSVRTLDKLRMRDKKRLIDALAKCAASDGRIAEREVAILRGVCGGLHCPVPPV
ncbi:MAG: M48 family metallopeptidase [Gammaproteobacteria bacterium]